MRIIIFICAVIFIEKLLFGVKKIDRINILIKVNVNWHKLIFLQNVVICICKTGENIMLTNGKVLSKAPRCGHPLPDQKKVLSLINQTFLLLHDNQIIEEKLLI